MIPRTADLGGGDADASVGGMQIGGGGMRRKGVVGVDGGLALMVGGGVPSSSVGVSTGTAVAVAPSVGTRARVQPRTAAGAIIIARRR